MALQTVELFQNVTVGATEDTIVLRNWRKNVYITCDDANTGGIRFALGPDANIDNNKALAAGERQPLMLEPGQGIRAKGTAAGQVFIITG